MSCCGKTAATHNLKWLQHLLSSRLIVFFHLVFLLRILPWHCIWDITGKTSVCPSRAPIIKAWRSTAGWWRRSGCPTCSLFIPKDLSSTTRQQRTWCYECIPTETCSTVWGERFHMNLTETVTDVNDLSQLSNSFSYHMWPWSTKPVIRVHFWKLRFMHHLEAE